MNGILTPVKSIFAEALPILEKFAPSIATAIGGMPGFALSFVIPLLAKSFGTDTHNLSDLASKILKDQDAPLKLQALEHQHHDWICAVVDSSTRIKNAEISVKLNWN